MPEHLYRFRSTKALLDGYNELESQQIYFCPPDKLNDPLEGFKDIFWRGDQIVWRNLLRHYLLNLIQAISIASIMGTDFKVDLCSMLVHQTEDDLPQAPIRDSYATACREFFQHSAPEQLISAFGSQTSAVRRDELLFYLRLIQPLAISKVLTALGQKGLALIQSASKLDSMAVELSQRLEEVLRIHAQVPKMSDVLFEVYEKTQSQLAIISEIKNPVAQERLPWLFISRDFPSYYVTALESLLYPDWHVACFASNPTNSSMWGTYGDGHRGVCLKFKTRSDGEGISTLELYRANSWTGSKEGIIANYAYVPHRFERVRYTAEFPEIDFFESIGTIPRYKLNGFWFSGQNGERSTTAARMLDEDETWRQEYWKKFVDCFSTKSPEWRHEEEYRLTLHSILDRFDDPESRKLKYQFSDLSAVIFGIKTTTEDKLRIMRIIESKCVAEGRRDFEFYQAHYSHRTKKIELAQLSLL